MMIHAYAETYLSDAMKNLGEAFDYAVNDCHIDIDEFMSLFISTRYAESFESGNPKIVSGLSGTELVMEILNKARKGIEFPIGKEEYDYSPEYWAGWILAYYQWETDRAFKDIHSYVSMKEIVKMYYPLHEAPEEKFVESLNALIKGKETPTRLQIRRKRSGLSQRELAEKSGVNIRTLQQYELGAKKINKASVKAILSLAKVLGCGIEDILEYEDKQRL